jgi:hypothetical protein
MQHHFRYPNVEEIDRVGPAAVTAAGTRIPARDRASVAVAMPREEAGARPMTLRPFDPTRGRKAPASVSERLGQRAGGTDNVASDPRAAEGCTRRFPDDVMATYSPPGRPMPRSVPPVGRAPGSLPPANHSQHLRSPFGAAAPPGWPSATALPRRGLPRDAITAPTVGLRILETAADAAGALGRSGSPSSRCIARGASNMLVTARLYGTIDG